MNPYDYKLFVDCGAPSLYNKLSRLKESKIKMGSSFKDRKFDDFSYTETKEYKEYRTNYIEYLLKNKDKIQVYSNIDVINNAKLTYRNQKILEEAGLNPIPVFHLGTDYKWLNRYLDNYEYIALGGLVPNNTSTLIPILDRLFKEKLLDSNGFPRVKLHGFACTSIPLMIRYPWYSVDSTTCMKLAGFGIVLLPNIKMNKIYHINVSSRDLPIEKKITKGIIKKLNQIGKEFGIKLEDASKLEMVRYAWNYLVFGKVLKYNLSSYPWNFYSKKSKKGAADFMTFYFAGGYKGKKEVYFWDKISQYNVDMLKGRLQSFYYTNQLDQTIKLKYEYEKE